MKPGIYRNWTNTAIHFAAYIGMLLLAMALCSGASLSPVTLSPPSGGTSHEAPILPSMGSPFDRRAVRGPLRRDPTLEALMTRTAYVYRDAYGDVIIDFSKKPPKETTEWRYRSPDFTRYTAKAFTPQTQAFVSVCYPQFRRLFPDVTLKLGTKTKLPEMKVVDITLTEVTP